MSTTETPSRLELTPLQRETLVQRLRQARDRATASPLVCLGGSRGSRLPLRSGAPGARIRREPENPSQSKG